jgi:hypothetical protein
MKTFLRVPICEKELARRRGARWDAGRHAWYVENVEDMRPFLRWIDPRLTKPVGASHESR